MTGFHLRLLAGVAVGVLVAVGCASRQPPPPYGGAAERSGGAGAAGLAGAGSSGRSGAVAIREASPSEGGLSPAGGDLRPIPQIRTTPLVPAAGSAQAPPAAAGTQAGPEQRVLDDFEAGLRWKAVDWANANQCALSLASTEGDGALLLDYKEGTRGKAAVVLELPGAADLSRFDTLCVDVGVHAGQPQSLAIAWLTDGYFESARKGLEPGWQGTLQFSLTSAHYKTAPQWEHSSPLRGLAAVRALYVLVYYEGACAVRLDNVRLLRASAEAPPGTEEVQEGAGR